MQQETYINQTHLKAAIQVCPLNSMRSCMVANWTSLPISVFMVYSNVQRNSRGKHRKKYTLMFSITMEKGGTRYMWIIMNITLVAMYCYVHCQSLASVYYLWYYHLQVNINTKQTAAQLLRTEYKTQSNYTIQTSYIISGTVNFKIYY